MTLETVEMIVQLCGVPGILASSIAAWISIVKTKTQLATVNEQLTNNGGKSMKDTADRTEASVKNILDKIGSLTEKVEKLDEANSRFAIELTDIRRSASLEHNHLHEAVSDLRADVRQVRETQAFPPRPAESA